MRVGQRVHLSEDGKKRLGHTMTKRRIAGTIVGFGRKYPSVEIVWDGMRSIDRLSRDFVQIYKNEHGD